MTLIKFEEGEGYIFCRWMHNRLIGRNKNVLSAELGATGSGKSYRDLRKAELWYDYYFKSNFPVENICFSIAEVIKLLSKGNLKRGEVIIFEEAGANLGSLDFQSKVSKMFTYVLQSFRSMNIAIFMNLPYFSMLNKQARMLLHLTSESAGINQEKKLNICKPKFLQINQSTGKVYSKYLIVKNKKGKSTQVKRLAYSMPSQYLIDAYETKKRDFLFNLTGEFDDQLSESKKETREEGILVVDNYYFKSAKEKEVALLFWKGKKAKEISIELEIPSSTLSNMKKNLKLRGIPVEKRKNA